MLTLAETMATVEAWDVLPFFNQMSDKARSRIAELLLRLIDAKDEPYGCTIIGYNERSEPIKSGGTILTPKDRLKWIETAMIEDIGKWPDGGFAEIRAFYCDFFPPGDGVEPRTSSDLSGIVRKPAPAAPKPTYPQLGDEPIPAEFHAQIDRLARQKRLLSKGEPVVNKYLEAEK